ncbi:MAG: EAL domain-containing protein [Gemmatimonadota bacterium]|nr:EAL domain-containing protein [Gemmatimonadota bacterium]
MQVATLAAVALAAVVVFLLVRLRKARSLNELSAQDQRQFDSLFFAAAEPMLLVDLKGRIVATNPAFTAVRAASDDVIHQPAADLFVGSSRALVLRCLGAAGAGESQMVEASSTISNPPLEVEVSAVPMMSDGEISAVCLRMKDITDSKQLERDLRDKALHDYLTNLPNRAVFQDRLEHAFNRTRRDGGTVALLYMDLDRFKPVNDRFGHELGDRVLERVARKLEALVRSADTVARVGGDEFAILLERPRDQGEAMTAAKRVVAALKETICVEDEEIQVGVSVGVAISDADTQTPSDLVRRADLAMYEAKKRGGLQEYAYHEELDACTDAFAERLEVELRSALDEGKLHVEYQPIIDVNGETLVGLEALVRWVDAEFGTIYPRNFIPIAEQSSLIAEVDRWVLERACNEVRTLLETAPSARALLLSVNIARGHFEVPDFIEGVATVLQRTRVNPSCVQLEIPEAAAAADPERVRRLKTLGVRIAVTEVGRGHSSLGYLRGLDVDVLKVDRGFVLGLGADPASMAVVRTVMTLAEILEVAVIIEGVEGSEQLSLIEQLGGRYVQGYMWGRPIRIDELPRILEEGLTRRALESPLTEADLAFEIEGDEPRRPLGGDLDHAQL